MSESTSTESARSRWVTRISIALAVIAVLMVIAGIIVPVVTFYRAIAKYERLHDAVEEGDTFAVRCFLLRGFDVNARDSMGFTALHYAAWCGHTKVARLLIDKGADVNAKDDSGGVLEVTVAEGQMKVFQPLIGWTPLHYASVFGNTQVTKLLIANGADVSAKTKGGHTPLGLAIECDNKETVALLRKHGAKE